MSGLCDTVACLQKRVKEATLANPKYKNVLKEMNEAAAEGVYQVDFDENLPVGVAEQLRNNGFQVRYFEDRKRTRVSYNYPDESQRPEPSTAPSWPDFVIHDYAMPA